ncbi:MAG TPA: tRNA lysidine(34) synthetase TilS [Devosia sp.]|nr:tRNA lysidine(34) synthetase TilS [Devosia sp.]
MRGDVSIDADTIFAPLVGREKLGLAVSGGPDSLALMLLAARWAKPHDVALFVYSVDHGLRPEAADEALMVKREAERLGLSARILRWEAPKPAAGIQEAARTARYRLMAEAMARDGVELLLTAHHLGDQAETVLMRMAHGSGIDGLRGMDRLSYVEGCEICRPLLDLHPDMLRAVVDEAGLRPAQDPSNDDTDYERVRWRQALPALEALGLTRERLGALARRMGDASSLIAAGVEDDLPRLVGWRADGAAELSHGRFAALNPLVAAALLGQVLQSVSGDRRPPPLGALESLQMRLRSCAPLRNTTLHGCVIASDGNTLTVKREPPRRATRKAQEKATSH